MCLRFARLAITSAVFGCCAVAAAQVPLSQPSETAGADRVVVLLDGQILTGQIVPRPDGYDVTMPAGRMFVPSQRVRFEADSMQDAYQKMRDSFGQLTPQTHLSIARWCVTHKQWSFARRELLDALHLDPHREDASRMLAFVERESGRVPPNSASSRSIVTVMPSTASYSGNVADSYSLGGLRDETARSFVSSVQPLIANKCGNTACHGPSRNGFEFKVPRYGSTPTLAEQNLAAVLRFVDPETPEASPLLTIGGSRHGPMRVAVFRGRTGARQMQVLRDWVATVAQELGPAAGQLVKYETEFTSPDQANPGPSHTGQEGVRLAAYQRSARADGESGVRQASSVTTMHSETTTRTTDGERRPGAAVPTLPHGRVLDRKETEENALRKIEYQARQDPFDPNVFNQMRHRKSPNDGSSGE